MRAVQSLSVVHVVGRSGFAAWTAATRTISAEHDFESLPLQASAIRAHATSATRVCS
jgi:hypothetical protein